jgi:hypothetical protein
MDDIKKLSPVMIEYINSCEEIVTKLSEAEELTDEKYNDVIEGIKTKFNNDDNKMFEITDLLNVMQRRIQAEQESVGIEQLVSVLLNLKKIGKGIIFTPLEPWSLVFGIISVIKRTLNEKYPYYDGMMIFINSISNKTKSISKEYLTAQNIINGVIPPSCLTGAQKIELNATKVGKDDKDVSRGKKIQDDLTEEFDQYFGEILMEQRKNDKDLDNYIYEQEWNDYYERMLAITKHDSDKKILKSILPNSKARCPTHQSSFYLCRCTKSIIKELKKKYENDVKVKGENYESIWAKVLDVFVPKYNKEDLLKLIKTLSVIDKFSSLKYFAMYYKQDIKNLPDTYIVPSEFCFTDNPMHAEGVKSTTHSLDAKCQVAFGNGIYPILPSTETVPNGGQPSYVLGKILEQLEKNYLGALVVGGKMDDGTVRLSIGMNLAVSWVLIFDPQGSFSSTERKQMGARSGRYKIETNGIVVELIGDRYENNVDPRVTIF